MMPVFNDAELAKLEEDATLKRGDNHYTWIAPEKVLALIAALRQAKQEMAGAVSYIHENAKAFGGIVGGGSEMFGRTFDEVYALDLDHCVTRLRQRQEGQHERELRYLRETKAALDDASKLREAPCRMKLLALTAGGEGGLEVHTSLSRMVRIALDAGITERLTELRAALDGRPHPSAAEIKD
jgi:hypothetical protein